MSALSMHRWRIFDGCQQTLYFQGFAYFVIDFFLRREYSQLQWILKGFFEVESS